MLPSAKRDRNKKNQPKDRSCIKIRLLSSDNYDDNFQYCYRCRCYIIIIIIIFIITVIVTLLPLFKWTPVVPSSEFFIFLKDAGVLKIEHFYNNTVINVDWKCCWWLSSVRFLKHGIFWSCLKARIHNFLLLPISFRI